MTLKHFTRFFGMCSSDCGGINHPQRDHCQGGGTRSRPTLHANPRAKPHHLDYRQRSCNPRFGSRGGGRHWRLDDENEAVEYKPIGTPTSVSSPQESSPAPYQLQKKREAASEIIRFAGAMIRVTSTVITRAIHFWRLSFVVQPVSNIAFKAYALACL